MPNPNYVASNPGGIPKSQISLRSTPTTTGGADNLTLLSFISWCGQTGTNYSGAPFSPLPSLPVAQPTLAGTSHKQHHPQIQFFPEDNISGSKYWTLTVLYFYCAGGKFLQVLQSGQCLPVFQLCCRVNTSSATTHCHPHYCITALNL